MVLLFSDPDVENMLKERAIKTPAPRRAQFKRNSMLMKASVTH